MWRERSRGERREARAIFRGTSLLSACDFLRAYASYEAQARVRA